MADWLRRSLAPLTEKAWAEVDGRAAQIIKQHLTARTLVDLEGPHGFEFAAANLGRLDIPKKNTAGVPWGVRLVQPLVELRIPVTLDQMELDSISRGVKDPDLANLEEAARKLALFEESAIYKGFSDGHIKGMIASSSHKPIRLPGSGEQYPKAVADAVQALGTAGIGGPYALVLGTEAYYSLMQTIKSGYPPYRVIRELLGGPILWSQTLDGGVVLSTQGGDFELTVGQDIAVGYASHDRDQVELYLVESFTFRVLEPSAAIELKAPAAG